MPQDPGRKTSTPAPIPDSAAAGPAKAVAQDTLGVQALPPEILSLYEVHEWRHACAILRHDFPAEYKDIVDILRAFRLRKAHIAEPGGSKSKVASAIDSQFYAKAPPWVEKDFRTQIVVDGSPTDSPTHNVDCYRNGVAVELEWNNKDPFFDRDLNNFRLLFDLRVVSVGVIITALRRPPGHFRWTRAGQVLWRIDDSHVQTPSEAPRRRRRWLSGACLRDPQGPLCRG